MDALSPASFKVSPSAPPLDLRNARGESRAPRTDVGTILIHWTASIACIVTLVTGLRLASDQEFSVVWRSIAPILPQGEIWSWHILSALVLTVATTAYIVYMHRSGLHQRIALGRVRALTLPAPKRAKWGALNILLHWLLYGLVLVQTVTGVLLYLGYGGWNVTIHSTAATVVLLYVVAHLIGHFGYGGWLQLLRVFKPVRLVRTASTRSNPLLIAAGLARSLLLSWSPWMPRPWTVS
jgi:cytochrome b subunit of formate dehydrogenase